MPGRSMWNSMISVGVLAALVAGCDVVGSDEEATANGVIVGIAEPKHLLPSNTIEPNGGEVLSALFYPLVEFDGNRTPVPAAAKSIKPDALNKVWTITLKPGLTFSNGEPVTSDSYLDAWNYGAYGPNAQAAAYFFAPIDGFAALQSVDPDGPNGAQQTAAPRGRTMVGLKKVDDSTFTVTLSAPFAGWDSVLGAAAFYPLPKAAFAAPGVIAAGFEDAIIGNGPFKLSGKWQHGSRIKVEKVAHFPGTAPKVDEIIWKIYDKPDDADADLVDGHLDVQPQVPVDRLEKARGELGSRLQTSPNSSFTFVGFPAYQPEYANRNVRRALSMAIDRKAITDRIFHGSQAPATAFVAPVVPGYRADSCGANCQYRPAEAKQLYTASNGPKDVRITYNTDGGNKAWADAVCDQIHTSLGVNCTGVGVATFADLLARADRREPVGMIRGGWVMDYPLMQDFLSELYATGSSSNHYGYSNPAFDSLLANGTEEPTRADAIKRWQQAENILAQDMPIIPLRFGLNVYGHSKRVTDVSVDMFQRVDVYSIRVISP
jgi:oligopeptide transport system substrate-binding protein